MNKLYYKSLEYLLYLLPISIIISNFFTNFIVYYLSIFGIFQLILKKKYDLINNKYCYVFVIFCIYITLRSLFLENNILFSLKSSVTLIRYLFFYVAIVTIIKNNNFAWSNCLLTNLINSPYQIFFAISNINYYCIISIHKIFFKIWYVYFNSEINSLK